MLVPPVPAELFVNSKPKKKKDRAQGKLFISQKSSLFLYEETKIKYRNA